MLSRREFNGLCAATLSLSLPGASAMIDVASGASAHAAIVGAASNPLGHRVKFQDGTIVSALGQGSWHLAQGRHSQTDEEEALRTGLALGMTLIDTAEMYGDGRSEELINHVIAGQRDRVFLVSKVLPDHTKATASRVLARRVSPASARIISISTYCTGEIGTPTFPGLWQRSKVCATGARFALGAFLTSRSATWKTSSMFRTAIAARPIKSFTTLAAAALS